MKKKDFFGYDNIPMKERIIGSLIAIILVFIPILILLSYYDSPLLTFGLTLLPIFIGTLFAHALNERRKRKKILLFKNLQ